MGIVWNLLACGLVDYTADPNMRKNILLEELVSLPLDWQKDLRQALNRPTVTYQRYRSAV
jgi:hypothetical protein